MGIKVAADKTPGLTFFGVGDTIADGQEVCAITRIARGQKLPKRISVTGYLDGVEKFWRKTVKVQDVAQNVQHLPRTWTRLETDRLVASGAAAAKAEIISLSKNMYVMSPFTSLLVLETEAMYKQYGIDRGRKDHWAAYRMQAPTLFDAGTRLDRLSRRTVPLFEQTTELLDAKERRILEEKEQHGQRLDFRSARINSVICLGGPRHDGEWFVTKFYCQGRLMTV